MELAKLFSRFFWIFGGLLFIIGLGFGGERLIFLGNSIETSGIVVDVRREQNAVPLMNDGTGFHYYPTVEFFPMDSQEPIRFESPAGLTGVVYSPGQEVSVRYQPDKPEKAVIGSTLGLFGMSGILGGTGLLFLIFGFVALKGFDKKKY